MSVEGPRPPGMDSPIRIEAADQDALVIRHMESTAKDPFTFVGEALKNSYTYGARHVEILIDRRTARSAFGDMLSIKDDGIGFPIDAASGQPDFSAVFRHYGQSYARTEVGRARLRLLLEDLGLQDRIPRSEFGVGIGSFYAVGTKLQIVTCSRLDDGTITKTLRTKLRKGTTKLDPVEVISSGFADPGTVVAVTGLSKRARRQLKVNDVAEYLRRNHRDVVADETIEIVVTDRRTRIVVEPSSWEGEYQIKRDWETEFGPIHVEIYLYPRGDETGVSIQRNGEVIYEDVLQYRGFRTPPWTNTPLVGYVDFPSADIADDRSGFLSGEKEDAFVEVLEKIAKRVTRYVKLKEKSEDEERRKSHERRMRSALNRLIEKLGHNPFEQDRPDPYASDLPFIEDLATDKLRYDAAETVVSAFSIANPETSEARSVVVTLLALVDPNGKSHLISEGDRLTVPAADGDTAGTYSGVYQWELGPNPVLGDYTIQMSIEFAGGHDRKRSSFSVGKRPRIGPLHRVLIRPIIVKVPIGETKSLRAEAVDELGNLLRDGIAYHWEVDDVRKLSFVKDRGRVVRAKAGSTEGVTSISVTAYEASTSRLKSSSVTVYLIPEQPPRPPRPPKTKFPNLSYESDRTGPWRSRYDISMNTLYVNSGHDDWVLQGGDRNEEANYILKLMAKEIALLELGHEAPADQVAEYSISLMESMGN